MKKALIFLSLAVSVVACKQSQESKNETADMYEASELSQTMRDMVEYSKLVREQIRNDEQVSPVPEHIWNLKKAEGTRDEHLEDVFQALADPYLEALKGLETSDSNAYYYSKSIAACKACHSSYCGGPLQVINQLGL